MKSTKIIYFAILCELVILNILFVRYWPFWLLFLVLGIVVFMFVKLTLQRRCLSIEAGNLQRDVDVNSDTKVTIRVRNTSIFSVSNVTIAFRYKVAGSDTVEKKKVNFSVKERSYTDVVVDIATAHVGIAKFWLDKCYMYDGILLFKRKITPKDKEYSFFVMPKHYANMGLPAKPYVDELIESDRYDEHKPGSDPSEVFAIREYQPGDKMNQIHWKLSSKTDALMVKEFSKPLSPEEIILFENRPCEAKDRDVMYEALLSLMYELLVQEKKFFVKYLTDGKVVTEKIENYGYVFPIIKKLILGESVGETSIYESLCQEMENGNGRTVFWITDTASQEDKAMIDVRTDMDTVVMSFEAEDEGINIREWLIYE